jgi:hypothetical protein
VTFTLPTGRWQALADSAAPDMAPQDAGASVEVAAHAVLLLAQPWN